MMITKKLLFSFITSCALLFTGIANTHAQDSNEAPDALIKRISEDVLDSAKADSDIKAGNQKKILNLVEQKVLPYVDFQRMTQLAAGRFWRTATPAQQQELVKQFRSLLVYTYSGALAQVSDQTLEYRPFRASAEDTEVEVHSQVKSPRGQVIELNYRLSKEANGWRIYDINVLGAWLVETYKGNFSGEINKVGPDGKPAGIDGLIKVLTEKNAKLANNFVKKPS